MMIIKKYDYIQLEQITNSNGKRQYVGPDKNPVPSVTTILSVTGDKSALIEWRKRVGEKQADEISTEASSVGTRMHKYLENYVETGVWPEPGSNPYAKKANHMASIIRDNALCNVDEIWGSEIRLQVEGLYAGTTDLVGQYRARPAIMDFKQANKPKKEEWIDDYFIQLAAYSDAHNAMYGTDIKEGHIFMCTRGNDTIRIGGEEYQQFDLLPEDYDKWLTKWYERVTDYYNNYAK